MAKSKQSILKWTEALNRHFPKENIQIANRHMKRCWASLVIREIHTKTTMRYPLTPVRMAIIKKKTKKQEITNAGKDAEKKESLCTVNGNVNWGDHYGKHYGGTSKNYTI